jgi:predicted nucleic acid-binding protein
MIVADASVIVRGLERSESPARLLLIDEDLHVPFLVDQEIAHALRGQVRRGVTTQDVACGRLERWQYFGARRHSSQWALGRIWELRDNLTAYDASYVALAESLGCPLATADRRLARAPGTRCEMIVIDH